MKILHLISDHQVIERALDFYDKVFPDQNEVIIFPDFPGELKFIKKRKDNPIVDYSNYKEVAGNYDFTDVKYVISHYMSPQKIEFIKCIPQNIHVCWEIYGGDFYNQFLVHYGFKLFYTNPEQFKKYGFWRMHFPILFSIAMEITGHRNASILKRRKLFRYITQRTNSLGVCSMGDKELLERYSGKTFPAVEVLNFSLKDTLGALYEGEFSNGTNIMVGNSASFSNNHLYVLKYLKELYPENTILLPCAYGGNSRYKNLICEEYTNAFCEKLQVIVDYLPLHQYNKMFMSTGIMIMSSWRQESWGNIFTGLYLGIKVYMSENNSFFHYLKNIGFLVFSLEKATKEEFSVLLTEEQKTYNRDLILKRYNDKQIESNFRNHFK